MSAQRKFATLEGKIVDEDDPGARFLVTGDNPNDETKEMGAELVARLKEASDAVAESAKNDKAPRKFVTLDGKVVPEGHPAARFLASDADGTLDSAFVAQIENANLAGNAPPPAEDAEAEPDDEESGLSVKKSTKPGDKAVKKPANK